jgi:hypothetical protein
LAEAFEHDQIEGLTDDQTIGQLAEIKYEIDSHGRMKIEPKEKARERGVRSPDRAEALMLALGKSSCFDLPQLVPTRAPIAKSHPIERVEPHPWGGFQEVFDQDETERAPTIFRVKKRGRFAFLDPRGRD